MPTFTENIGKRLLRKRSISQKAESLKQLRQINTVGIVYNVITLERKQLNSIAHFFESEGKKVFSLGFVDSKELDSSQVSSGAEKFYCRKQLNIWNLPKGDEVNEFINKDYDYLINLDGQGTLPLQAISAYSKAKVRMAKYFEEYAFSHDFMAETETSDELLIFNELKKYITKDE